MKSIHKQQLKISTLTQHPEVRGQGGVGCKDVDQFTPEDVRTDKILFKNEEVVKQPGNVTESESHEQVLVHGDSATAEGVEQEEDDERHSEEYQRQGQSYYSEGAHSLVKVPRGHTVSVV